MPPVYDFGLTGFIDKGHVRKAKALLNGPNRRAAATAHTGGFRPTGLFYLYDEKRLVLLPELLAAGADLEARNKDNETALMQRLRRTVATEKDWECLLPLIRAGANVNAHTPDGCDVLQCWMLGPGLGHLRILDELLRAGASPRAQVAGEMGPLARAVMSGASAAVVDRLLAAGASPDEVDRFGHTAKTRARSRPEIAELLVAHTSRAAAAELRAALPNPRPDRRLKRL